MDNFLLQASRPGRYVGNELNVIRKEWNAVNIHIVLGFPDAYEIGMSNLGMAILYHILNKKSWVCAERVYSPWIDMEKIMRDNQIPLFSLESRRNITDFDVLAMTVQYELQFTNIINMLDLSRIPIQSRNRTEEHPLVIVGGPGVFNPEPLADFIDAALIGDGEQAVLEIANTVNKCKNEKLDRIQTLRALSGIKGIYVPSFYDEKDGRLQPRFTGIPENIEARIIPELQAESYPEKPLVPLIDVTHDRLSVEIMRGCTRGCRFCNAGMIYRPFRARPVKEVLNQIKKSIDKTGLEEVSLVSLSTSDYPELKTLLSSLKDWARSKNVSIAFPSLRPDSFTEEIADLASGTRRTGLTFAPEAGTQRLRNVINKNNTDSDLVNAARVAFSKGWQKLKLYFMIGLPTESKADLDGIIELVKAVAQTGREYGKKEVHVSISPFSPKPHTPFQWEAQNSLSDFYEKIEYLRKGLNMRNVTLRWRDPEVSVLEAALGRGDRKLSGVIFNAWENGSRFDAWSELFDYENWKKAFEKEQLTMEMYTGEHLFNLPLPWDHIQKGVTKTFLFSERQKAISEDTTDDCRESRCRMCGLMNQPACNGREFKKIETAPMVVHEEKSGSWGRKTKRVAHTDMARKLRIGYIKQGNARYTGHHDTMRVFIRALRRANIEIAMSQGFHAHPKISACMPLNLGFTSSAEYMDMELAGRVPENFASALNDHLPEGFEVFQSGWVFQKTDSLSAAVNQVEYVVHLPELPSADIAGIDTAIKNFLTLNSWMVKREKKGKIAEIDIRLFVDSITRENNCLNFTLNTSPRGTARVDEIINAVWSDYDTVPVALDVERKAQWIVTHGQKRTPMEVI